MVETTSGATPPWIGGPRSSSQYAPRCLPISRLSAAVRRRLTIVSVAILAPFPDVAMHIKQAKSIRPLKEIDRRGCLAIVSLSPGLIVGNSVVYSFLVSHRCCNRFPKVEGSRCSRPAGVFPFGFSREAIGTTGMGSEAIAEFYHIAPGYLLYR